MPANDNISVWIPWPNTRWACSFIWHTSEAASAICTKCLLPERLLYTCIERVVTWASTVPACSGLPSMDVSHISVSTAVAAIEGPRCRHFSFNRPVELHHANLKRFLVIYQLIATVSRQLNWRIYRYIGVSGGHLNKVAPRKVRDFKWLAAGSWMEQRINFLWYRHCLCQLGKIRRIAVSPDHRRHWQRSR